MVVGELLKWMKTSQKKGDLYFYRTRSGLELDLLLLTEYGMIGTEIRARKTIAPLDLRGLKEVGSGLGKEWREGLVIYQGNALQKIAEPNIWAVPSRRLFL